MVVLEAFEAGRKALSIFEIAKADKAGPQRRAAFRLYAAPLGYLRCDGAEKRYTVSHKIIDLARSLIGVDTRPERVGPILERIARHAQETAACVELDDLEIVILKSVPSTHLGSVNLPVGQRFAALSSSSGQVMLAHTTPNRILRVYHNSSEYARGRFGRRSDAEVLDYFREARAAGCMVTEKMEDQDSISLSVPVLNPQGAAVGARDLLSDYLMEIGQHAARDLFS